MSKKIIYLDNSATTPVDPRVLKEMLPYFSEKFGNASSLHQAGLDNRVAVDRAQAKLADFLGCDKNEVYFTSGATESDNMAIFGIIKAFQKRYPQKKCHLITSQIEHDAILEPCHQLEKQGVEITYLPVNSRGLVELSSFKKAIKANTVLASVMYVNNEIGTIQPIAAIGRLLRELNKKRKNRIYFHTDATQAPSYCDCDVKKLGVDLLSLSGHKIYGPKGVGAIYLKAGTPFTPIIFGGHQQENVRSGTYNVPGIVGLGKAIELLNKNILATPSLRSANSGAERLPWERGGEYKKIKTLRNYLIREIKNKISGVMINGDRISRVPSNVNFIFKGVEGESVVLMLSQKGIAASTGSACSSGSLEPSHVLLALGVKPELAHGSLRITLGRFNTMQDVKALIKELPPIIAKLRKMARGIKY